MHIGNGVNDSVTVQQCADRNFWKSFSEHGPCTVYTKVSSTLRVVVFRRGGVHDALLVLASKYVGAS